MKNIKPVMFICVLVTLFTAMAVTVSAASITIDTENVVWGIKNDVVSFTVPYTSEDVEQITILAIKGTKDGPLTETDGSVLDENILYVDQQDATEGIFEFEIDLINFNEETPFVYIKIGGTSIETPKSAGGLEIWSDPVPVLVYGDVNNDEEVNVSDVVTLLKYIQFKNTSQEGTPLDTTVFKAGENTFKLSNVNADDDVNVSDAVMILTYISKVNSGGTAALDPGQFPGGKFPAYTNNKMS